MKRKAITVLATACLVISSVSSGFSQDSLALLDILVRKGILTQQEADKLAAESAKQVSESQSNKGLVNRVRIGD
jgi:hypothetical protein